MGTTLLTHLEERLAADRDGTLRAALTQDLRRAQAQVEASRSELRSADAQKSHAAARRAIAAGLEILDKARVGE